MRQVEAPRIVRVARQNQQVGVRGLRGFEQAGAGGGVSVPRIHVERQFRPPGKARRQQPIARVFGQVVAHLFDEIGRGGELAHQHLLHHSTCQVVPRAFDAASPSLNQRSCAAPSICRSGLA